jgi:hypothetical protein
VISGHLNWCHGPTSQRQVRITGHRPGWLLGVGIAVGVASDMLFVIVSVGIGGSMNRSQKN